MALLLFLLSYALQILNDGGVNDNKFLKNNYEHSVFLKD